jgi:hypothetical protein
MNPNKQEQFSIAIRPDGSLSFIYDDKLADLCEHGEAVTRRVSYVEPSGKGWTADLAPVNGPVLGPYRLREDALATERQWLEENLFSEV